MAILSLASLVCISVTLQLSLAFYPSHLTRFHPLFHLSSAATNGEGESDNRRPRPEGNASRERVNGSIPSHNVTDTANAQLLERILQLEDLVAKQSVQIKRLQKESEDLIEAAASFARVVELLRAAGSNSDTEETSESKEVSEGTLIERASKGGSQLKVVEAFDESSVFGTAPSNVIEAADGAGASILAGLLGGKQRMLVDVRDADLASDEETLVQFLELAVLPVAAGLEGLVSHRNRLKIVFPTVGELLHYRKTMALAAPEVVALSTLGFDPVEERDNLVVIVAPGPDDEEGLAAMNELLMPTRGKAIRQPVVVINPHMTPVSGPAADFESIYHLRLLSVQYMAGSSPQDYLSRFPEAVGAMFANATNLSANDMADLEEDEALEAAMRHAHEQGSHTRATRAMVVRAYPRPWHVFVDTSPDTDADFEVAATFDKEPSSEDINMAIVECLEGSEQEDELVAKQMQAALEEGQLDKVNQMLEDVFFNMFDDNDDDDIDFDDDEEDEGDWDDFKSDSI